MSAISPIENVVVAEVVVKTPKVKKPALPAKLQKFASTIYFILQKFNEQGLISDEDLERGIVENHLFDHVDNLEQQTVVLQALLDQQPAALKSFRKTATARNKPPKAPKPVKAPKEKKAKEPKAKKEKAVPIAASEEPVVAASTAASTAVSVAAALAAAPAASTAATITPAPTKTKKTKAAKAVVNEVVAEAEAEVEVVAEVEVEVVEEKKVEKVKKEKKEKVAKEPKEKVVKEKVAKEPKEKAPKKTKNAPKVTSDADEDLIGQIVAAARSSNSEREEQEVVEVEEDEDEDGVIQTREFSFEGTLYLIDQDNLLYSSTSHEQIGSLDPVSNSIVPL